MPTACTVNICSYRYGHLAAHAIESVLNQTRRPDVIRFYDDGAGDCNHLPEIYPEVQFILRHSNLGIVANFNDALNNTETDRVLFLGADNWLAPDTIELCLQFEQNIVSFDAWKYGVGLPEYWHLIDRAHGSAMYDVALAKSVGGYEAATDSNHTEEDTMLFNKMREAGASLFIIPEPLLGYRWRHRRNYNQ